MNVKQALKKKARLVKELHSTWDIIHKHNSIIEGNQLIYNIADELGKVDRLILEIVELKERIHRANLPVYDHIFQMSELKNYVKELSTLDTKSGVTDNQFYGGTISPKYVSQMGEVDKNILINHINEMIDELQDTLDTHNATTEI